MTAWVAALLLTAAGTALGALGTLNSSRTATAIALGLAAAGFFFALLSIRSWPPRP